MSGPRAWTRIVHSTLIHRRELNIVIDVTLVVLAYAAAFLMRFDGVIPPARLDQFWFTLPALLLVRLACALQLGLDRMVWRYVSTRDVIRICECTFVGSALFIAAVHFAYRIRIPSSVYPLEGLVLIGLRVGLRVLRRTLHELSATAGGRRVLIVGAGDAGEMIIREIEHNNCSGYTPVGFVDDDPAKIGRRIHGIPVIGRCADLRKIVESTEPEEVLIAMPRVPPTRVRDIVRNLEPCRVPIRTVPNLRDLIDGVVALDRVRNVSLEDLLPRAALDIRADATRALIEGRSVMVTGAGGSIGSELCRLLMKLGPRVLVMYERHENSLYAVNNELRDLNRRVLLAPLIGDVCDRARVAETIATHRVDLIFHAAAHKHVPMMEANPCEAIKNNVRGTRILLRQALEQGVQRFILISSDKAVNPSSVMGASKRVAEMMVQATAARSGRSFASVRFGNVLGSSGSVVPMFLEQIRKGGPVTVTHPEMRRFFMLIREAVQLVLHASAIAEPGAVYVLEMGDPMRIADLARHLIRLSGSIPDEDIGIEFTGLRPGEKLSEMLSADDEISKPSQVPGIREVRSPHRADADHLMTHLIALERAAAEGDGAIVMALLKQLVPTFRDGDSNIASASGAVCEPLRGEIPARRMAIKM